MMDRLEQLERGWLFYKLRWFLKSAALVAASLAMGGIVAYWLASAPPRDAASEDTAVQMSAQEPKESDESPAEPPPQTVIQEVMPEPVYLKPDFGFEQEIAARLNARAARPVPTEEASRQRTVVARSVDLGALKSRFEKSPTYDRAVEIARAHLRAGEAKEALEWALKANGIDNEDPRSWAVFATATARLGDKKRAASSLRAYLQTRSSEELSNLLAKLEQ